MLGGNLWLQFMAFIIMCGRVGEEEGSSQENAARELRLRKQLMFIVMPELNCHIVLLLIVRQCVTHSYGSPGC